MEMHENDEYVLIQLNGFWKVMLACFWLVGKADATACVGDIKAVTKETQKNKLVE